MRTKTLLVTAALGAAGVASAVAQVYSVNAVGYVNMTVKPGFNTIANPLDAGAGNNTASKVLAGVPDGTTVYKYVAGSGYTIDSYSDLFGWDNPDLGLAPGEGFFIQVPAGADVNLTFVGEVPQGDASNMSLPAGFALVSSKVPQAGKLATDLKYPATDGDTVYTYANPGGYTIYSFTDLFGWDPQEPSVAVGQAFWSQKSAAASWTRNFSVNQ